MMFVSRSVRLTTQTRNLYNKGTGITESIRPAVYFTLLKLELQMYQLTKNKYRYWPDRRTGIETKITSTNVLWIRNWRALLCRPYCMCAADASFSLTRWQQIIFSVKWRHGRHLEIMTLNQNQTSSVDAYLREGHSCQISSRSDLKRPTDGALDFLKPVSPTITITSRSVAI